MSMRFRVLVWKHKPEAVGIFLSQTWLEREEEAQEEGVSMLWLSHQTGLTWRRTLSYTNLMKGKISIR